MNNLDWIWLIVVTTIWTVVVQYVWYAAVPDPGGDFAAIALAPVWLWLILALVTWRWRHTTPAGLFFSKRPHRDPLVD